MADRSRAPILRRKLVPPALDARSVARPRLQAALTDAIGAGRHVLLVGGPGYGKSTVLAEWAASRPVAWLSLDDEDADPVRFVRYLAAAIVRAVPGFGSEATDLLEAAADRAAAPIALDALIADLEEQCPEPICLVLDDFTRAETPATGALLAKLLRYLPPEVRILAASRRAPPVDLTTSQARKAIALIQEADLAFDRAELAEVLAMPPEAADAAEAAHQRTGGWPAAWGMSPGEQEAYIEAQYLADLPAGAGTFLLRASLLDGFAPEDCELALGIPLGSELLSLLRSRQLLRRAEDGTYDVSQPVRDLLRKRVATDLPPYERAALLLPQAEHFWSTGRALSAVHRFLEAGSPDLAVRRVREAAETWLADGRLDLLESALAALGEAAADPALRLAEGDLHRRRGSFERAELCFRQAALACAESGDERGLAIAHLRDAQALASRGRISQARAKLATVRERLVADDRLEADALNLEAGLCLYEGDTVQAAARYQASLGLSRRIGDTSAEARAAHNLGVCSTRLGDLGQALASYDAALALGGQTPVVWMTPINRALVLAFLGRLPEARAGAEAALDLVRRFKMAREEGYALRTLGHALSRSGDGDAALACFDGAIALSKRIQDRFGLAISLNYWADAMARAGDAAAALARSNEALALVGPGEGFQSLEFAYARARILARAGKLEDAGNLAADALAEARSAGYRYWEYGLLALGAAIAAATGNTAQADALSAEAATIAQARGYGDLLTESRAMMPAISASASVSGSASATASDLVIQSFGGFRGWLAGDEISDRRWQSAKAKLLLAFLLEQPEGAAKERLVEAIYGNEPVSNASFNMTLVRLRKALEPDLESGRSSRYILRSDAWYGFNWQARASVDTRAFEAALRPGLDVEEAHLQRALELYKGDYLPEFEMDWVVALRQRYRDKALSACRRLLARYSERAGSSEKALQVVYRAIEIDPLSEEFNREAILRFIEAGEASRARAHWQLCERRYRDLQLEPPQDLRELINS
jgi:ATP/maltotriose-dependent transcriptional regulator MalT/two-component SAPR family response regulator